MKKFLFNNNLLKERRLGIEVDGEIHDFKKDSDAYRSRTIEIELGIKIIRFENMEVERNIDGILKEIITK